MPLSVFPAAQVQKSTYSAGVLELVPPAAATDVFTICGSSTKTIVVTEIEVNGTSSSKTIVNVQIVRRSTADTGGTSTVCANTHRHSGNPEATATVRAYTANPTLGTLVGIVHANKLSFSVSGTDQPQGILFNFDGDGKTQGIYLRGTNECLCVNLNGETISSPSLSIDVAWYEE